MKILNFNFCLYRLRWRKYFYTEIFNLITQNSFSIYIYIFFFFSIVYIKYAQFVKLKEYQPTIIIEDI